MWESDILCTSRMSGATCASVPRGSRAWEGGKSDMWNFGMCKKRD